MNSETMNRKFFLLQYGPFVYFYSSQQLQENGYFPVSFKFVRNVSNYSAIFGRLVRSTVYTIQFMFQYIMLK